MMGVRDERGALVGAAIMTLPASPHPSPAFIALRESIWAELGAEARARYDAFGTGAQFFAALPPHHHLNMIGVRRAQQRLGIARELLTAVHALAKADSGSAGVSLTTERAENLPFYERFGYKVIGHARVSGELGTWGMANAHETR